MKRVLEMINALVLLIMFFAGNGNGSFQKYSSDTFFMVTGTVGIYFCIHCLYRVGRGHEG